MENEDFIPMDKPQTFPIELKFTKEQYKKLTNNKERETRDDRWILHFEDDTVHCYRTMTGYEVFRAKILNNDEKYFIFSFDVEFNKEKYNFDDFDRMKQSFTRIIALIGLEVSEEEIKMNNEKKEVTKCEKGHIYDSNLEKCPFCSGTTMDDLLKKIPKGKGIDPNIKIQTADCYFAWPEDFDLREDDE